MEKNALPMKELVVPLERVGTRNIDTYIQSGNVIFQSTDTHAAQLSTRLTDAINKRYGFSPHVPIFGSDAIERTLAQNPF